MPKKQKSPAPTRSVIPDKNRCRFTTIDGRQCRMYRAKRHKTLCLTHAQQEDQLLDAEAVAEELIGPVEDYRTAICVNRTLGCLFNLVAQKRISRQDGALLAFIAQTMLHSVGSTVRDEYIWISNDRHPARWEKNVYMAAEILGNHYSRKQEEAEDRELDEEAEEEPEAEAEPEPEPQPADATIDAPQEAIDTLMRTLNSRP